MFALCPTDRVAIVEQRCFVALLRAIAQATEIIRAHGSLAGVALNVGRAINKRESTVALQKERLWNFASFRIRDFPGRPDHVPRFPESEASFVDQ